MDVTSTRAFPAEHDGTTEINRAGQAVIRFERELKHSVERVWAAITNPTEIVGWLAHRVEIDPRVGGEYVLWLGDSQSPDPKCPGTISEFSPPWLLVAALDDGSVLRFELQQSKTGTTLVFTDTRPAGRRAQNSVLAGWHLRMDLLPEHLAGTPAGWRALDRDRGPSGAVAAIEEIYWHYRNQTTDSTSSG